MQASKRFTEDCRDHLRAEIADAGGNEVFARGYCDEEGIVIALEVAARGNEGAVLALDRLWNAPAAEGEAEEEGRLPDVLIHNHPSGFLSPSDQDFAIAARAAEGGVGSFIVDNGVERVYVIAEPVRRRARKALDAESLCAALEEGGAVSRRLPSYEIRPSQLDLMRLIIRGFNEDVLVAAEAGTGVGKSFAYLLPALSYALANQERILISTATITLQQQLFDKDIPLVIAALNKKLKVVLIKGRGNFLCRRRLADALRDQRQDLFDEDEETFRAIEAWADTTTTGSRSDLSFVPRDRVWSRICSEADLCMGMRCPERERCFVLALKKEAADAKILVVNHHLLFADLAARQQGAGYEITVVLPPYRRVIIDEAHTIEDAATSFFSKEFSRLGIYRQTGRLYRQRRGRQQGLLIRIAALSSQEAALEGAAAAIQRARDAADALDGAARELCGAEGVFRLALPRDKQIAAVLVPGLVNLRKALTALVEALRSMAEAAGGGEGEEGEAGGANSALNAAVWELRSVIRRLETVISVCGAFIEYAQRPQEVMWIEERRESGGGAGPLDGGSWAVFTVTPLEVASSLGKALFEPNKTVVCLSATLTTAAPPPASFAYWNRRSGICLAPGREVLTGQFPSPFPYGRSVLLAVPGDAPLPDEARYQAFVERAVPDLAGLAGGSALVLFTSYESLRNTYAVAAPILAKQGIRCLKQGDDDRSRLLAAFLADESSVLFGTDSFWEGVDAPGDTLRLVILCRLPFRTPRDPVFEARREALEKQGGNSFMELSLPEAVIKFKQGFGRLIRRSGDRGVVAVLDGRIIRKRYGDSFIRSLPKTRTSFGEYAAVIRAAEDFLFP
ncbi:MAG: ATP-dependent DNA helicase DinG [Spirochaetaceae bacterium]|jgi:ATP-dependent DNA helicase DinG|nr:ATP-dependent DNA helicase DinG [Spirochaetaceae bacterium]